MSVGAMEKALWNIYLTPGDAQRYREDPQAYAAAYRLDDSERENLEKLDVMALIDGGANALLVMMVFQTVEGVHRLHDYFAIVNEPLAARAAGE